MDLQTLESIIEELLCPICLDCFNSPVMLHCHHTFCNSCISIFFKYSKTHYSWKVNCPVCRSLTSVSCSITDLPSKLLHRNYIVSGVVSKMSKITGDENQDPTGLKENNSDGQESKTANGDEKVFCKLHKKNRVKYYCKSCNTLVCRVCTILNHREHELVFPHEISLSHQEELEIKFEQIQNNNKKLDAALKTINLMISEIRSRTTETAEQVEAAVQLRTNILKERKKELLGQLDKIVHNKIKKLMVQKDQLEFEYGHSRVTMNDANVILKDGSPIEKLNLKTLVDEQLLSFSKLCLEPEEDDTIMYEVPNKAIDKLIESMGTVESKSTFADISYAHGEALEMAKFNKEAHFTIVACSKNGQISVREDLISVLIQAPDGSTVNPAIENLQNGEYSVTFVPESKGKHKIEVNLRGRPIQKSPFYCNVVSKRDYSEISPPKYVFGIYGSGSKEFKSPLGVAADKDGLLYVSDCYNHRLQIYGSRGEAIYSYGSQGCRKGYLCNPSGLFYCPKSHRLFMCDTGNFRVQVFNLSASPTDDLQKSNWCSLKFGSEGTSPGYLKSPCGVAVSPTTQEIAVCDTGNNCVQLYSPDGVFISRISGGNSDLKLNSGGRVSLNYPTNATFEPETDLLYISDSKNNRILIYDRRSIGRFVRKIESTSKLIINNPKGLAFDQANNLIIVNSGSNAVNVTTNMGEVIRTFCGSDHPSMKLSSPEGICVLPDGNLALSDCCNNRIIVI